MYVQTHSTHRHTLRQAPCVSGRTEVVSLDEIKIERDGARRKLADCLTTQCFRFCSGTPSSPPPKYTLKVEQSALRWSVLAGPSRGIST